MDEMGESVKGETRNTQPPYKTKTCTARSIIKRKVKEHMDT